MPRTRRRFTAEFKAEAVKLAEESGRPLQAVAEELGVHVNQLRSWRKERLAARADARDQPAISIAMKSLSQAAYLRLPLRLAFREVSARARLSAIRRSKARFRAALRSRTRLASSRKVTSRSKRGTVWSGGTGERGTVTGGSAAMPHPAPRRAGAGRLSLPP